MNSDKNTEKAFELAEQFEFKELLDKDKKYILSIMSETDYNDLRKAIVSLPGYFEKEIEPITNIPLLLPKHKKNKLKELVLYPLQLYKVAASVIIAFSLFSLYQHKNENPDSTLIAQKDTVFIHITDTIFQIIQDTVWVVEKKESSPKLALNNNNRIENEIKQTISSKDELHPDDVEKIMAMTKSNSLANDSVIKNIFVLLN